MAISAGVGPHFAWLNVNGATFPVLEGHASITATKKTGTFSAEIALGLPGVESTLGPSLGDNTASIMVSTRGQQASLITGEIDEVDFDYIKGTVSVTGRDASAKLHAQKSSEKWANKQPGDIIQDIAGRVGLSPQIDPLAIKAGRIIQIDWTKLTDGISYGSVVHKLAEFMGAHWYVQGSNLVVKTNGSTSAPYVINYSPGPPKVSDAISLRIRRNVQAGKPIKVDVKSWHSRKKHNFVGTTMIGGNGSTQNYVYHVPSLTQDHADQHSKAKAKDHARHEIEVTVECVGDPSIVVSQPLQLNGTAFAQSFDIDSIEHRFGMSGHVMVINAKSAAHGRS